MYSRPAPARQVPPTIDEDEVQSSQGESVDDTDKIGAAVGLDESAVASLDVTMRSLPLSQGKQQLLSLARALLMRSSWEVLVLLDEASSSIDAETDETVQKLVKKEFTELILIMVAHRLNTVMDSDMVMVMQTGQVVEVGPPLELAAKQGGR